MITELVRSLALAAAVVASTGAPIVTARAAPASPLGPLHRIVQQAAIDQGISYALLDCIVQAESTYNPRSVSPTEDYGLANFHRPWEPGSLWQQFADPGADWFDPTANAETAARAIAAGYGHRWATWRFCG